MPAERAGYTVTMFVVDTSPSMGKIRTVDLPPSPNGEQQTAEMTNLEWSLQFVKLKIQEMIYNGRKTDQCGVIVFGSPETDNIIHEKNGGYEYVAEYIPIAQPNAATLAKIDQLKPSDTAGDPLDGLIVAIETQSAYLSSKKTWTRKIILMTDGENPIEIEDWEATVRKMDAWDVSLTVVGIDFDDEELPYHEKDKSDIKRANEAFYSQLTSSLQNGVIGTCALALREIARPDIKVTKSVLMGTVLRLGDVEGRSDGALEVAVKTSKCTAITRPKGWKKFARRVEPGDDEGTESMVVDGDKERKVTYAQLRMRTEYFVDRSTGADGDQDENNDERIAEEDEELKPKVENMEKVEKEQLVRGFKYGSTYVPCPDGQFARLETKKGIDILGFFKAENFRHELAMGEVQYIWADPASAVQQVALSSIVQAMKGKKDDPKEKELYAIARWVTRDGADPKMGVLAPSMFEKVDCLLWTQMPFADDVRKYTFASLDNLVNRKGEPVSKHPYIPTNEQIAAMDKFVDAMDLMEAGEKDEEGNRMPWFDTILSYNPAIHRTKQALFHCAVVSDLNTNPLPPPHPELLKFFEPPKRVLKRATDAIDECAKAFKVKTVPKKAAPMRKDGHVPAQDDDGDILLLDAMQSKSTTASQRRELTVNASQRSIPSQTSVVHTTNKDDGDTESEADDDELVLPTPERSESPIDMGKPPGRIIGTTFPLADFQKNIAKGDVVSKAVEDFAWAIQEIIRRPFAARRMEEMITCMKTLRDTALKEDEIDAWNAFLLELRNTCEEAQVPDFWETITKVGKRLGPISKSEAKKYGGSSNVTDAEAEQFFSL